jgi:DNA-binding PadR family transcriptional regulator
MTVPLTPAVFHVLLALAGGRRHGYAIAKDVEKLSHGEVRMGPGTLYGTLRRLLDQGWIVVSSAPLGVDERRRYYRLTSLGRKAVEAEVARMHTLVRAARAVKITPGPSEA